MHRQLVIVALVAIGAQGCSGDGNGKTNPCDGETCSGHGRCVADEERALCDCDPGYRPVGPTCVADCFAVDCGGLGGCIVVEDEPVCVCDQGYEGVGLDCRPAPETCHGIGCSGHGGCVEIDGEPACICETGYAPLGVGCVPVSCTNVHCSDHGACVLRDGAPSCQCDPGYMAVGLGCRPDQCLPGACSGRGACALVEGKMECTCDHGYLAVGHECRPLPCEFEDCSNHGACVEGSEGLECICDPGYVAVELSCRPRCSGVDCSGRGVCVQDRSGAHCLCEPGYTAEGERCVTREPMPDSGVDGSMADGGDSDAEVPDSGDTTAFCPGAAVPTDSFDDDVVGGHWTCWGESAIEVTESGGALHFAFEDGIPRNGEHQCRWEPIAIGGRQFTLEIADIQAPANVSLHFRIRNPGTDLTDDVVLHRYESQMFARARVAGTQTTLAAEPFTNASHRFWRFREAAGEISFEVSGDGRTFRPLAVTTPSFDPTTAAVVIGMYAFRRVGGAGSASIASLCAQ